MHQCESRMRLLATALELIWRQSYGAVGVDQICEHSGVKKGSFYHFFRSKSELTVAAYKHYWEREEKELKKIFLSSKKPLRRIEDYIEHLCSVQRSQQIKYGCLLGCPFASLGCELSTRDERIRLMAREIIERACVLIELTLKDAVERFEIQEADSKMLARELYCYTIGLIQEAKIANDLDILNRMKPGVNRLLGLPRALSGTPKN
jgi:TetR/AcrR family transcriptional regulator, transcriptional repressor for nem operon